jgi:hypothetical protein
MTYFADLTPYTYWSTVADVIQGSSLTPFRADPQDP